MGSVSSVSDWYSERERFVEKTIFLILSLSEIVGPHVTVYNTNKGTLNLVHTDIIYTL